VIARRRPLGRLDATGVPLLIARLVLAYMFITMGAAKLADPITFLKLVRMYEIVPEHPPHFLNSIAVMLPWFEIVTGTALLIGILLRGAALTQLLMLVPFTFAVLRRTMHIMQAEGKVFTDVKFDCGCGGGEEIIWRKVLINAALFVLALYVFFSRSRRFTLERTLDGRQPDSAYCHLCGYAVRKPVAGLCEVCATPPVLPTP